MLVYSRKSGLTVGSVIEALGHCADEHSGSVAGTYWSSHDSGLVFLCCCLEKFVLCILMFNVIGRQHLNRLSHCITFISIDLLLQLAFLKIESCA